MQRQLHQELEEPDLNQEEPGDDCCEPADDWNETENLKYKGNITVDPYHKIPKGTHGTCQQGGVGVPVLDVPHLMGQDARDFPGLQIGQQGQGNGNVVAAYGKSVQNFGVANI